MARERYLLNSDEIDFQERTKIELTPKQKRQNFFYYNTVKIIVALFLIGLIGAFIVSVKTKVKPDYSIALITQTAYGEDIVAQIKDEFKKYGEDINGDGKVTVNINSYQYLLGQQTQGIDSQTVTTGITRVIADFEVCESLIFLTDDKSFENILPNVGTDFFVNYKTGEEVPNGLTDFSEIRAPYSAWKAFGSFQIKYDEITGMNYETVTSTYMDGLSMSLRVVNGTQHEDKEEKQEAFSAALKLIQKVTGE